MQIKRLLYLICLLSLLWILSCEIPVSTETRSGELSRIENALYTTTHEIFDPAWSPDGGQIAFVSKKKVAVLYKTSADGINRDKIARIPFFIRTNLCAISPDEQYIVFTDHSHDNQTGRRNTYLYSVAEDKNVLFNDYIPNHATLFKWSRDSRTIYCYFTENAAHTIRAVTPEGTTIFNVVLDSTDSFSDYSVAPDNQSIAWACLPRNAKYWQIRLYTPANGQQKIIAADSVDSFHPSWSPDGGSIAYHSYDYKTSTRSMKIYSFENSSSRSSVENIDWFKWIVWSDDGGTIYFNGGFSSNPESGIWAVSVADNSLSLNCKGYFPQLLQLNSDGSFYLFPEYFSVYYLYAINVESKKISELVHETFENLSHPVWSPDGASLVFSKDRKLCRIPSGGGEPVSLDINSPYRQFNPAFSPDGSLVAFDDGVEIFTVSPNGGAVKRINPYNFLSRPTWSPDGKQIACAYNYEKKDSLIIFDYADGKMSRVKAWPGHFASISWSKPLPLLGSFILFTQTGSSNSIYELKALNPENDQLYTFIGETGSLNTHTPNYLGACWSPDPEIIAWIQNYNMWGKNYYLNTARIFVDLK